MILYVNVIITDNRIMGFRYNRYGLPGYSRYDIFKYSLASLAALNKYWSRVIFCCTLERPYTKLWNELEPFVKGLFGDTKVIIYQNRNVKQKAWQECYERDIAPVNDSLIWYHGNDDHIFIDYDLTMLDNILSKMYNDPTPFITCIYSHWPEYIRFAADNHAANLGCAAVFNSFNHDAIHVFSKKLFKHWLFKYRWKRITRSDVFKFVVKLGQKCYVPYRELVRHFDGYSHSMHLPHVCPPLHIPPGFFKRDIKILYCGNERRPGWLLVNPTLPYRTVDHHRGADYRYTLQEIPLFWRDRISEIEVVNDLPKRMLYNARNFEKIVTLDSHMHWSNRRLPVLPASWMAPWIFLRPEQPTLA